jgi:hypothetical protein
MKDSNIAKPDTSGLDPGTSLGTPKLRRLGRRPSETSGAHA